MGAVCSGFCALARQRIKHRQAAALLGLTARRFNAHVQRYDPAASRKHGKEHHESFADSQHCLGRYLAGEITAEAAAGELGISKVTFLLWARQSAESSRTLGLPPLALYDGAMSKKYRKHREFALFYALWCAGLLTGKTAAAALGVHYTSFYNWKRAWEANHQCDALKWESERQAQVFALWQMGEISVKKAAKRMNIKESQLRELARQLGDAECAQEGLLLTE